MKEQLVDLVKVRTSVGIDRFKADKIIDIIEKLTFVELDDEGIDVLCGRQSENASQEHIAIIGRQCFYSHTLAMKPIYLQLVAM